MVAVVVSILVVLVALVIVHEAATLGVGRLLGLRGRIKLTSLGLVQVVGVHVAGPISPARRTSTIFAGFVAVYIALAGTAFVVLLLRGMPVGSHMIVVETVDGTPAAGVLRPNDRLVTVDGLPLPGTSLVEHINKKRGAAVTLHVVRGGDAFDATIVPRLDDGHWRIGLQPGLEIEYVSDPRAAIAEATAAPFVQLAAHARGLYGLIAGSDAEPVGPVRMVQEFARHHRPYEGILLGVLLGSYVWLLLGVLDLVRLLRTPR